MDNQFDHTTDEEATFLAIYSNEAEKTGHFSSTTSNTSRISDENSENSQKFIPLCINTNPYVMKNDGWIPQHIWIAPRTWYSYLAIYMAILTGLCCFLNGIVVAATMKYKALRQPLNYVIVNLAVADLLAGVVGGFVSILANISGYFFWGKWMCLFEGYAVSIFGCTGLNTIALMAFERYVVVCKPFGNVPFGHKASMAGLAVAWFWGVLWNTPPLLFWDGYDPEGFGTSCAPNWFVKEPGPRIFIILYFVFAFTFPYGLIIGCYGMLIVNLRKIAKQSSLSGSKSPEGDVARMVILMVSAFLIAWSPYATFAMYNALNPDAQISYALGALPAFFAKSATLYNPLIYIGFNRQFRDHVIRMFCNGKNPWSDELGVGSAVSSQIASQITTIGTNKVAPA